MIGLLGLNEWSVHFPKDLSVYYLKVSDSLFWPGVNGSIGVRVAGFTQEGGCE